MQVSIRNLTLAAAAGAMALASGCQTRKFNAEVRNTTGGGASPSAPSSPTALPDKLPPGIPNPEFIVQGVVEKSNARLDKLFITDESNRIQNRVNNSGGLFSSVETPSAQVKYKQLPGEWYGQTFHAALPAKCNDIASVFLGTRIVESNDQLCTFEAHSTADVVVELPTGVANDESMSKIWDVNYAAKDKFVPNGEYWGFSIIIIPLGAPTATGALATYSEELYEDILEQKGKTQDVLAMRSLLAKSAVEKPASDGAFAKVDDEVNPTAGTPSPNVKMDEKAVLDALNAIKANSYPGNNFRNSCLMNYRARNWTDIAAHYYCQLPYEARSCYSGVLVREGEALEIRLRKTDSTYQGFMTQGKAGEDARNAYKIPRLYPIWVQAWKECVESADDGTALAFIRKNQAKVFKYIMWTVPGMWDFNNESEQKVLNDFYGSARPRRALDTFESWAPTQPRYDKVRDIQAMRIKAASSSSSAP
jgi:hypothetical protein